eukprot:m.276530 g.276530  ORF g.276530 m.276530 type:complete len:76 (-) comp124314_c0_seq1:106-333(-)
MRWRLTTIYPPSPSSATVSLIHEANLCSPKLYGCVVAWLRLCGCVGHIVMSCVLRKFDAGTLFVVADFGRSCSSS